MKIRFVAAATLLAVAATASADGIREGKWEYTVNMKMANMPEMPKMPEGVQMPPGMKIPQFGPQGMTASYQHCITNDKPVPQDEKRQKDCKVTKMDRSGNNVTWVMHCESPEQNIDGEGSASYTGDTMTSTSQIKGTSHGQPIDMTQDIRGRYLGPCT